MQQDQFVRPSAPREGFEHVIDFRLHVAVSPNRALAAIEGLLENLEALPLRFGSVFNAVVFNHIRDVLVGAATEPHRGFCEQVKKVLVTQYLFLLVETLPYAIV